MLIQRCATLCLCSLIATVWGQCATAALQSELVISNGLSGAIFAAAPSNDFDHLYIAEGTYARLKRLNLETKQLDIVLDLPNAIPGSQAGLNGFAFHPDYANNGKLYVNYSGSGLMRILEFTRSTSDPNVFDPTSEREILTVANPSGSHNAGWIGFGPHDEYLYVATGDGGNVPPQETKGIAAQDLTSLQGKMLRIDVNSDAFPEDVTRNYAIPSTNPFESGGGLPEIFAYGLRHSFMNGFDRQTGDLYIADVGSAYYEEINFLPAGTNGGQNYGWRPREGFVDNPLTDDPSPPNAIDPIHAYARGASAAVVGGVVYRGDAIPSLQGTYFFADFEKDQIFSLRYDGSVVTELMDRTTELASPLGSYGGITTITEDAAGELYILDYLRGDVYKITPAASNLGDFNGDGKVDAADYVSWRRTDGSSEGYNAWRAAFGTTSGTGNSNVPEPSTCGLVIVCSCIGILWRRKQN